MDDDYDHGGEDTSQASLGVSSILRAGEEAIEQAAGAAGLDAARGVTNDMVADLMRALNNEKAAPDLLPYEGQLVAVLLSLLVDQQRHLDQLPVPQRAADDCVASLYEMDVARLRGMLAGYHRIRAVKVTSDGGRRAVGGLPPGGRSLCGRVLTPASHLHTLPPHLAQIHKWAPHIQANDGAKERLSPEEAQLHDTLCRLRGAYLADLALGHLPDGFRELEGVPGVAEGPGDGVHVFARVLERLDSIPSGAWRRAGLWAGLGGCLGAAPAVTSSVPPFPTSVLPPARPPRPPAGRGDVLEPMEAGESVATLYRVLAPYVLQRKVDLL